MALNILTISPENNKNDIAIDSGIVIEFDANIDPFTVVNGVNLYTKSEGLWSGPDAGQLDTIYSDVLDITDTEAYYPLKYQITDNILTILPVVSLIPDKEHFLTIYPGNDASRYISKRTVGSPIIIGDPDCKIEVTSPYTGPDDEILEIGFTSTDGVNVDNISVFKGIFFVKEFPYTEGSEINIGELTFILTGSYTVSSSISLPVYRAVGVTDAYQIKFTTSKYTTVTPRSHKIEYFGDAEVPLAISKVIPDDNSVSNQNINPIVVRFNKVLKQDQDLLDKITIKRTNLASSSVKNIKYYYRIISDTIKIYMLSATRDMAQEAMAPTYELIYGASDSLLIDNTILNDFSLIPVQEGAVKTLLFNCHGGKYIYIITPSGYPMLTITSEGFNFNDVIVTTEQLSLNGRPTSSFRIYRSTYSQTGSNIELKVEG